MLRYLQFCLRSIIWTIERDDHELQGYSEMKAYQRLKYSRVLGPFTIFMHDFLGAEVELMQKVANELPYNNGVQNPAD